MLMKSPFFKGLDDFFDSKWVPFATTDTAFPMDIIERDDAYEVKVAVPGVNRDKLSVTIENGNLHIEASGEEATKKDGETYILKGLKGFQYQRIIPNIAQYGVQEDKITSGYKDGILCICLPKAEEIKPKTIAIEIE